jgi:plasmid stabilization system protein ParE
MSELLIAEAAEEEYTASLQWYAQRSKTAAERFEAEFAQALEGIETNPERYPACEDDRHRFYLLKRFPFQLIYRKAEEERWLIIAVAHTSRKPGCWSRR